MLTHACWKCEYEDTKRVQVRHNNVNVFVRTLKTQKRMKTYTVEPLLTKLIRSGSRFVSRKFRK